jgi:hypothetical protein
MAHWEANFRGIPLGWKAAEVLPLDDHAIVRGHAVFDTCTLASGCVYRWDSLVGPSPDHLSGWRSIQQSLGSPRAFMNYIILYNIIIYHISYIFQDFFQLEPPNWIQTQKNGEVS